MSTTQNSAIDALARVHRLIEELALAVVLGSGSGCEPAEWCVRLEQIAGAAAGAGWRAAAEESNRLRNVLAAMDPAADNFAAAARAGIEILQQLAGEECRPPEPVAAPPAPAATLAEDRELVADFIMESREHLQAIEHNVLAAEQDPSRAESIHAIFRAFHTIKGLAGFLEFAEIREVSHETETLLDLARNGSLTLTAGVIDVILASADYLDRDLRRIEAGLNGAPLAAAADNATLLDRLRVLIRATEFEANGFGASEDPPVETQVAALALAVESGDTAPIPTPAQPAPAPAAPVPAAPAPTAPAAAEPAPVEDAQRGANRVTVNSVKVDTTKLDFLIDMVGEMVIAQSLVRHSPDLAALQGAATLQRNIAQLSRITDEVQKTAMAMRMVPVGMLFQKMTRLVRDLSRKSGKPAELVTTGEDTELDRNIVEALADPLMHMVRNALDHGIEPMEDRVARGKPRVARVELKASHQSGHIVIEISDDGRGMDRNAILRKARERGVVDANAQLTDAEIYNLIFEPGFSTAEKVTDISGRGVGMDVVKRHIQKLRGRTEIITQLGRGTTFRLKLPLTLAIIDGLIVGVGKERYIVPIFAVKELLRPTPGMVSTVEGRHEIALVRERVLPVVRLHRRFAITPRTEDPLDSLLVITESQGKEYCLMVDALIGKQEVVIKSLGESLKDIPGIAGGAILGDGRVGLILDMHALFSPPARI